MISSHARVLSNSMKLEGSMLRRDAIDVHRSIAALSSDIFIQRIPSNALDVVVVFGNFVDQLACEEVSDTQSGTEIDKLPSVAV